MAITAPPIRHQQVIVPWSLSRQTRLLQSPGQLHQAEQMRPVLALLLFELQGAGCCLAYEHRLAALQESH